MADDKPMTPEQEEAYAIAESQPMPKHVINQAAAIGEAAADNRLLLTTFVPLGSKTAYYMISTVIDGLIKPLAIIPPGMDPADWLCVIDKLITKHGTRELDRQFDGHVH